MALAVAACSGEPGNGSDPESQERLGSVRQAITDTDSDGMDDGWETSHFGSLSRTGSGDFDSDGMTDLEEYVDDFDPTVDDAFEDADGDRYPNVFELRNSADPRSSASTPTATYLVDGAGGGTHTTISAAMNAANVSNGGYQIIAIAPGVYSGAANLRDVTVASSKPQLLFIGLEGAGKTVIDGGLTNYGWLLRNGAVVASLTLKRAWTAFYVDAPSKEVRFVDVVVRENTSNGLPDAAGIHVSSAARVHVVGSTFLDNVGVSTAEQIWIGGGAATLVNTVVSGQSSGTKLAKATSATLTTNYCLVKGQTLTGTGNLSGSTDAKTRSDGRLLWDSPLRAAGGTVSQSLIDIDGETRPSTTPDIGVDQFVDSDSDDLADKWETTEAGDLTTLTGRTQDADSDGLTNEQEYAALVKPTVADSDGDGASDGAEVTTHGSNPLVADTDGDEMPDGWEISNALSPTVANGLDDKDGDRYPNIFEYASSTDPSSSSSVPTPTYVVNAAGGGTHTTISAALGAANVQNGAYQIIGIAAGVYTGGANLRDVTIQSTKPKLLFIGLDGAGTTIIDGGKANYGWWVRNTAVISSLTFRNTLGALFIDAPSKEVRLVDLLVQDNVATSSEWATPGVHVQSAAKTSVIGSTFLNNAGPAAVQQLWINEGTATVVNTLAWSQASGTMVGKSSYATWTTDHCLAKGQTLTGTGNLAGNVDAKIRSDGRLLWDSPLRGAGGTVMQSRVDLDGETRPSSSPDIGVDQFVDSDADELADKWELAQAGNLTTLTSRTQDAESDGLANDQEYVALTNPTVADTDGDGLSDGNEVNVHGTSPLKTDTDSDDMPDAWEVANGLSPVAANAFEDADGDRYPNVFEYASSTNPSSSSSVPTPTYVVNAAGGGTHTTVSAALAAADVLNGAYQIIGIAPGVYTGAANLRDVTVQATKPKLLFIGLEGAGKTIIDGGNQNYGWWIRNSAVIASLTFRNTRGALYVEAPSKEVGLFDLLVTENVAPPSEWATPGLHVQSASKTRVFGSTFLDNKGGQAAVKQLWINEGAATVINSVAWSKSSETTVGKSSNATWTTSYCLAKGQTLTGTGNLAGTIDPKLQTDARLSSDSPLRAAGGSVAQSRIDIDGELRPLSAPDIGVDQFVDSDVDSLPDAWEITHFGNVTTIAGAADEDSDGLSNAAEYDLESDLFDSDTDNDGVKDGFEVQLGKNPLVADGDDLASDLNQDGLIDSVGVQLGYHPDQSDDDGDSVSNADEVLMCTNPFRADTDGDGVPDNTDVFPHDPFMSAFPSNPSDATPPVITLTSPWYAVLQ